MIPRTWLLSPEGTTAMSENIAVALVFLLVLLSVLVMLPGVLLAAPLLWGALKIFDGFEGK